MRLEELKQLTQKAREYQGADAQQAMYEFLQELGMDPHSFYQELEMTSKYVDTHRDISYSNVQMSLHSHTFYELIYCCNNCGAEYLIGSDRYSLQQGDILFLPPGISHKPILPEALPEPYTRYVLWLSQEFVRQFAQLSPFPFTEEQSSGHMLRFKENHRTNLGNLFRTGVQEAENRVNGWETAVLGNTLTLLTSLRRAAEDHTIQFPKAVKTELLDRIMAFIEQHYAQTITISYLAREFYVSNSTISHMFQQKLGISLYRFVTQRRLIAAKTLIEAGIPLETIAVQIGFQDYSSFYRAFKQEYGISPKQYKSKVLAET